MTEVLSQKEIDELLTAITKEDPEQESSSNRRNVKIFDLKRPDYFTSTERKTLGEYLARAEDIIGNNLRFHWTTVPTLELDSKGMTTFALPQDLFLQIPASTESSEHALTKEKSLVILNCLAIPFEESWTKREHVSKNKSYIIIYFDNLEGTLHIPIESIKEVLRLPKQDNQKTILEEVKIPTKVVLGTTDLQLGELNALDEGSLITLDQNVGEAFPIYVGGQKVGSGEIIVIDDKIGVRVTNINI